MSKEADTDSGLMVAEDEQMNVEKGELDNGSLENQTTVMMTGKEITEVMTPSKVKGEKNWV